MPRNAMDNIFKSMKGAFLPALIFAAAVFYGTAFPIRGFENNIFFHGVFLSLALTGLVFFSLVHEERARLIVLCLTGAYLFLNGMKGLHGAAFFEMPAARLLFLLLPLNIGLISLLPHQNIGNRQNFYLIVLMLGQGVLLENLPLEMPYVSSPYVFLVSCGVWLCVFGMFLLKACRSGSARAEGLMFMTIAAFLGVYDGQTPEAFCLYFSAAVLLLLSTTLATIIYACFRDEQTGVYSRRSFYWHAARRFPLKYSLGVICLDDYAKLKKVFTKHELRALVRLVLELIRHTPATPDVYRFGEDEFVLIFQKEDKKQAFQYLENIRREIAGTTFVLNRKKSVKITVSAGVSEKKRSDADAEAVLIRTREVLQKAYKFTQNITSMA